MGGNSLPKTVTQQHRSCDLNPGPTVPESSMLSTRLPSHPRSFKDSLISYVLNADSGQWADMYVD